MTLEELLLMREGAETEVKAAQGKDGRGEVPVDFWETYSAFANSEGGVIILGAKEARDGSFVPLGIKDPDRLKKDLWNALNNPQKVSINLLSEQDVETVVDGDYQLLVIKVPPATRRQRPVFIKGNPLTGTFRRNFEGDFRCSENNVRRMLADADEETRDAQILFGFTLDDLDRDSLNAYRNLFRAARPTHPWLALDDQALLERLGGWRRERNSGQEGPTLAGILMFGKFASLHEAVSLYQVDYQEKPGEASSRRWEDRVTTDGTWSGNLFDFYFKVRSKLIEDLKLPFQMVAGHRRVDETPIHEALREALVNTLIHADYSGSTGILVVKRPDGFTFRNPGGLRLPVQQVERGGISDCRNRHLQQMFQMIGEGEKAGSGYSEILTTWQRHHWQRPLIRESETHEETILELPTVSLLPPETVAELERRLGAAFQHLDEVERIAMASALLEGEVSHGRLRELSSEHPRDLTIKLQGLVRRGLLLPAGVGRYMTYHLPTEAPLTSHTSSPYVGSNIPHSNISLQQREEWLASFRQRRRVNPEELDRAILAFSEGIFRTAKEMSEALGRSLGTIQNHYLPRLLKQGKLELRYPDQPRHRQQAYRTKA